MKLNRPSPAMVVAVVALVMSMTGGAIAAVNFARNSGKVDGYDAVRAGASLNKAAGNLVATYPRGENRGKLPFRTLSGAASTDSVEALADVAAQGRNGAQTIAVPDNAQTTEANMVDLGVGNLQVACFDQDAAAGTEDAATRVTITNHSGAAFNIARRLGTGRQFIRTVETGTAETFVVGVENTYSVHIQAAPNRTVLVEGAATQTGPGTADSSCGTWATALFVE
jgi:hypothetical protein